MSIIYAIIVTYNGSRWVDKCFGSLVNSIMPVKILAIDNGSTDGTPNLIRERFPQVEVIETRENLGFGKANNIGIEIAVNNNADFVLLLNQDAWLEMETVIKLLDVSKNFPEYGILSPIQYNGVNTNLEQSFKNYLGEGNTPDYLTDLLFNRLKSVYETHYTNAASWFITKECLRMVGGFNPLFFHYGEDDEYLSRCKFKGFKIGIVPEAKIWHDTIFKEINPNGLFIKQRVENLIKGSLMDLNNPLPSRHLLVRDMFATYFRSFLLFFRVTDSTKRQILKLKLSYKLVPYIKSLREIALKDNYPFIKIRE